MKATYVKPRLKSPLVPKPSDIQAKYLLAQGIKANAIFASLIKALEMFMKKIRRESLLL